MHAVRNFSLSLLLVAAAAGTVSAQPSPNNDPGTYDVKVAVAPGLLPGGAPSGIPTLGSEVYEGTLTIVQNLDGTYSVQLKAESTDGKKLMANGLFESDWAGFTLGSVPIESGLVTGAIVSINAANLISANINGVGIMDSEIHRAIVKVGAGGTIDRFNVLPAPGNLR